MSGFLIPSIGVSALTTKAEAAVIAWNWDFSLIKLEAPKEFSGVGSAISELRRTNAENGDLHKTARRLGALFEGIAPEVPDLLRAYGRRVSEICEMKKIGAEETRRLGLFSRFAGPDATSIWAAATSGDNAIAIHLLACMIAKMFDGSQAVSLWTELVQKRKVQLETEIPNLTDQIKRGSKLAAKNQDISRKDLADWDNSARAWVQTADDAKSTQRCRYLNRAERMGAVVNTISDPYESVVQGWKDAMVAMNNLVTGLPQRVSNGALLLGMSAWHLYPDMNVLSQGPELIRQDDPLVAGTGILTIDLEPTTDGESGIRWSLPLSCMRYYGAAVTVDQQVSIDSSRITMDQFGFVLLGCVMSQWHDFKPTVPKAITWATGVLKALHTPADSREKNQGHIDRMRKITSRSSWLGQLLRAAEQFEEAGELERETALKLINNLGRRFHGFLCDAEDHPPPLFGLSEISLLFPMLNGPEPRIAYLRQLAKHWGLLNASYVIQYRYTENGITLVEYASVGPFNNRPDIMGDQSSNASCAIADVLVDEQYARWLSISTLDDKCECQDSCLRPEEVLPLDKQPNLAKITAACPCWEKGGCSPACHVWVEHSLESCHTLHGGFLIPRSQSISAKGEACFLVHSMTSMLDLDNSRDRGLDFGAEPHFPTSLKAFGEHLCDGTQSEECNHRGALDSQVELIYYAGDLSTAAILKIKHTEKARTDPRTGRPGRPTEQIGEFLPAKVMDLVFDPNHFEFESLTQWFVYNLPSQYRSYVKSLRACAAVAEMYSRLPGSTIQSSLVKRLRLKTARWIPKKIRVRKSLLRLKLSRAEAFACLAMFESGGLNLDPDGLQEVFAMSSGNSIFASAPIICDPYDDPLGTEIQRVPGNIGESGISFLVPPPQPLVKDNDESDWSVINHCPFDGVLGDSFGLTTIHLLKTDFNPEIRGMDDRGYFIDRQATLREIVAQVFHGSKWVADLNILGALENVRLSRVTCQHTLYGKMQADQDSDEDADTDDDDENDDNNREAAPAAATAQTTISYPGIAEKIPIHSVRGLKIRRIFNDGYANGEVPQHRHGFFKWAEVEPQYDLERPTISIERQEGMTATPAEQEDEDVHGPQVSYTDVFPDESIIEISCWDELLTEPLDGNCTIVRASGNWLARLAATAISVQLGRDTAVLPKDVCWTCVKKYMESKKDKKIVLVS